VVKQRAGATAQRGSVLVAVDPVSLMLTEVFPCKEASVPQFPIANSTGRELVGGWLLSGFCMRLVVKTRHQIQTVVCQHQQALRA